MEGGDDGILQGKLGQPTGPNQLMVQKKASRNLN